MLGKCVRTGLKTKIISLSICNCSDWSKYQAQIESNSFVWLANPVGGVCYKSSQVWSCRGENILKSSPCPGQPCLPDGEFSTPCLGDGSCPHDWCLSQGRCQFHLSKYACGSTCIPRDQPCHGLCPLTVEQTKDLSTPFRFRSRSDICIIDGKCQECPKDFYSCNTKPTNNTLPCNGACPQGKHLLQGICYKGRRNK